MQIIKNTKDEEDICNNKIYQSRQNSLKINYFDKVNDKPLGKEYLAYQNNLYIYLLPIRLQSF